MQFKSILCLVLSGIILFPTVTLSQTTNIKKIQKKLPSLSKPNPQKTESSNSLSLPIENDAETDAHAISLYKEGAALWARKNLEGLKKLEESAQLGNSNAMLLLGTIYLKNETLRNDAKAFEYFNRAAHLMNAEAMAYLGQCYRKGTGTQKNANQAIYWAQYSTDLNSPMGMTVLGICYEEGTGVEKDYLHAAKLFLRAAELDNVTACYNIAQYYENGYGVKKNMQQALLWYKRAAALGDEYAPEKVKELSAAISAERRKTREPVINREVGGDNVDDSPSIGCVNVDAAPYKENPTINENNIQETPDIIDSVTKKAKEERKKKKQEQKEDKKEKNKMLKNINS